MPILRAAQLETTDDDLLRVARLFGIERLELIGGFENLLYRSVPSGFVVRLTHTSRRSGAMVEAELAFMEHLVDHGLPVVAPVRSQHGSTVEPLTLESGETVVTACVTAAAGERRRPEEWSPADIQTYGATLGAMHVAARSFEPPPGRRRPVWTDPALDAGLGNQATAPNELFHRNRQIKHAAIAHPAGGTDLLIHQDAHYGNLFLTHDGRITLFDFDDATYGTATHDVAIVLFYWLVGRDIDPPSEARAFLADFMAGYERHASLPTDWPDGADLFLSYREIDIFWLLDIEPAEVPSPLYLRFMEGRRQRILEGVPYCGAPLRDIL